MIALTFLFLTILSTALIIRGHQRVVSVTVFLTLIAATFSLKNLLEPIENANLFFGIIALLLGVNFIVGNFIKKAKWRFIIPLLTIGLLFLLGKNAVNYNAYTLDFSQLKVAAVLLLGFAFGMIIDLKLSAVTELFPSLPTAQTERAVTLVVAGLFTIFATFIASWFGFLLLAIGFFVYNAFAEKKRDYVTMALLMLALCANYVSIFELESIDLSIGKVIAGLFIGAGIVALASLGKNTTSLFMKIVVLLLVPLLIFLIANLDGIHPAYGGAVSFSALIFGSSLSLFFYKNNTIAVFIVTITTTIGFCMAPEIEVASQNSAANPKTEVPTERIVSFTEVDGVTGITVEQTGVFKVASKDSKINFQLGPKGGVTKGEISNIEGTFELKEDLSSSTFSITLPVSKLTTFNEMRDESLMEDIYFDVTNHPLMSFKSNEMIPSKDGYILKGTFTMLSKSQPLEVFVKFIESTEGKLTLVGQSTVDRTKFGMASSPQEGDLVDFHFNVKANR